jgi:hypothetical protein
MMKLIQLVVALLKWSMSLLLLLVPFRCLPSFWHLLNLLKLSFILALFIVPSPAFSCHIYICAFLQLTPALSYLGFWEVGWLCSGALRTAVSNFWTLRGYGLDSLIFLGRTLSGTSTLWRLRRRSTKQSVNSKKVCFEVDHAGHILMQIYYIFVWPSWISICRGLLKNGRRFPVDVLKNTPSGPYVL